MRIVLSSANKQREHLPLTLRTKLGATCCFSGTGYTITLQVVSTSPTALLAVHLYVPESFSSADRMCTAPTPIFVSFFTFLLQTRGMLFLNHLIVGFGPTHEHTSFSCDPSATVWFFRFASKYSFCSTSTTLCLVGSSAIGPGMRPFSRPCKFLRHCFGSFFFFGSSGTSA